MPDLKVQGLSKRFGGIVALDSVSFEVRQGEILGLIGPNGAGKTTVFNCISRLYDPDVGSIHFDGKDLLRLPPHQVIGAGIARTFQNVELFKTMAVLDNLLVGQHALMTCGFLSCVLRLPQMWHQERLARQRAREVIQFLGLEGVTAVPAGSLPFGIQKRVELARALVSRPQLVLLDEPASGLSHEEILSLGDTIESVRKDLKVTVLLVEHHMDLVMAVSDRVVVLNFGRKIAEGPPAAVQHDPAVIEAYLGEEADAEA